MARSLKLRDVAAAIGLDVGCGDNSCIWGSPGGMATNGGCRCKKGKDAHELGLQLMQMQRVARHLLEVYNVLRFND